MHDDDDDNDDDGNDDNDNSMRLCAWDLIKVTRLYLPYDSLMVGIGFNAFVFQTASVLWLINETQLLVFCQYMDRFTATKKKFN